jgi:hypothetical protein
MSRLNLRTPTAYAGQKATTHKMGAVRFATAAEALAGVMTDVAVTPATASATVPAATTTVAGKIAIATNAETVTGTNTTKAVTPDDVSARLKAPGAIGGTTPAAATFTTLTSVGTASINASGAAVSTIGTGGTGAVQVQSSSSSGIDHIEALGKPGVNICSVMNAQSGSQGGLIMNFVCYKNTAVTAPTSGTLIQMQFFFNNSAFRVFFFFFF